MDIAVGNMFVGNNCVFDVCIAVFSVFCDCAIGVIDVVVYDVFRNGVVISFVNNGIIVGNCVVVSSWVVDFVVNGMTVVANCAFDVVSNVLFPIGKPDGAVNKCLFSFIVGNCIVVTFGKCALDFVCNCASNVADDKIMPFVVVTNGIVCVTGKLFIVFVVEDFVLIVPGNDLVTGQVDFMIIGANDVIAIFKGNNEPVVTFTKVAVVLIGDNALSVLGGNVDMFLGDSILISIDGNGKLEVFDEVEAIIDNF